MCCFTRPVQSVTATNIFVRDAGNQRQFVVYSMYYRADEDLAMVLPLPVPLGTKEDAVNYIDLQHYDDFFTDLKAGFPERQSLGWPRAMSIRPVAAAAPLKVVQVGSFEASFVPQISDFARLDARFRMPDGVWDKLPQYKGFGFAVFKLRKDSEKVHPMAFVFPRVTRNTLFFPTFHVHDGQVHKMAHFDHYLYCQPINPLPPMSPWRRSEEAAAAFMRIPQSKGIVDPYAYCYKMELQGDLRNQDWVV
jgi:hypothetical protein